jgi:hypothetical protein
MEIEYGRARYAMLAESRQQSAALFYVRSPIDDGSPVEPYRRHLGIRLGTRQELFDPDEPLWDGGRPAPVAIVGGSALAFCGAPGSKRCPELDGWVAGHVLDCVDALVMPNSPPTAARTRREIARYASDQAARAQADPAWALPGGAVLMYAQPPSGRNGGRLVLVLGRCPGRWDVAEVEMPRSPVDPVDPDPGTDRYTFDMRAPGLAEAVWTGRCAASAGPGFPPISVRLALVSQSGPAVILDGVTPGVQVRLCNNMLPLADLVDGAIHVRAAGGAPASRAADPGWASASRFVIPGGSNPSHASAELIVPLPGEPFRCDSPFDSRGNRLLSFPGGATGQGLEKQWAGEPWMVGERFFPRMNPRLMPVVTYVGEPARPTAVRFVPQERAWGEFVRLTG